MRDNRRQGIKFRRLEGGVVPDENLDLEIKSIENMESMGDRADHLEFILKYKPQKNETDGAFVNRVMRDLYARRQDLIDSGRIIVTEKEKLSAATDQPERKESPEPIPLAETGFIPGLPTPWSPLSIPEYHTPPLTPIIEPGDGPELERKHAVEPEPASSQQLSKKDLRDRLKVVKKLFNHIITTPTSELEPHLKNIQQYLSVHKISNIRKMPAELKDRLYKFSMLDDQLRESASSFLVPEAGPELVVPLDKPTLPVPKTAAPSPLLDKVVKSESKVKKIKLPVKKTKPCSLIDDQVGKIKKTKMKKRELLLKKPKLLKKD